MPFVGAAGQLLGKLLAGIGLDARRRVRRERAQCRPPGNRDPQPEEIEACEGHLFRQIELIQPKVVATLGNFATKLLSGKPLGITRVHGQEQEVVLGGSRVLLYPLFHPAAALYTPRMLDVLEADFRRLPELLGRTRARASPLAAGRCDRAASAGGRARAVAARPLLRQPATDGDPSAECKLRVERHAVRAVYAPVVVVETASAAETEASAGGSPRSSRGRRRRRGRASSAPARRRSSAAPAGRSASSGPVSSPTFTIGHRYEAPRSGRAPRPLPRPRTRRRRSGATSSPTSMARLRSSSGPSTPAPGCRRCGPP